MNLISSARVRFEELRSLAFGEISGAYTGIGDPFENPVRILKVTNLTDSNLLISFNGIDDQDIVASNGFFLYDFSTNKADQCGFLEQSAGTRIYAKLEDGAATSGNVYVTIIYASQV